MTGKGTPRHTIRIADGIWDRAEERAETEGKTLVNVIREFLTGYGETRTPPTE